jgi:hypothetical protein
VAQLKSMLSGAGGGAGSSDDRIRKHLAIFRETGRLEDARAARLVCWGTTLGDGMAPPLLEDGERFPVLVEEVDAFRRQPRSYRRCWRGLLDGYIRYDPESARGDGRRNWHALRAYLNDNLPDLDRGGHVPDWLVTIDDHDNLLSDDPCARYGADLLEHGSGVLDPLRQDLSIGESSWLLRRIFEAQIAAAVSFGDTRLREVMPRLIDLIQEHATFADAALVRVLDRYVECASRNPELSLQRLVVERWGNPWLERNDSRWMDVRPEARQMVSSWLKERLIERFFGLMSEDEINDQRRIEFWKRHVDRITDMHFALGEAARRNPSPDFRQLRKEMHGLLVRLESGGSPRNNAFIMRIGGYLFVEFGEKGNAMFVFSAADAPFDLSRGWVAGNRTALKHPSHIERLIHGDSGGERWERKLDRCIERLTAGGQARSRQPAQAPPPAPAVGSRAFARPNAERFTGFSSGASVDPLTFLVEQGIAHQDLRSKGGSLWAMALQRHPAAADLRRLGFEWSTRRSSWYLKR